MLGKGFRPRNGARLGRVAAGAALIFGLTIAVATPSHAADCPPDRPLCRLFSTPTTVPPAPAPVVTVPTLPPVTVAPPPPPAPAAPRSVPEAAQRLLDLVNGDRAKAGLGRLASRSDVVAIALAHSQRMAASGTIFHNDSYFNDSIRGMLNTRARGENVAQNSSVDDTHTRLMNSPGHRANILDPRFTVVGFAVVQASDGRYYTTQDFLQPAGDPAVAAPAAAAVPATRRTAAAAIARPASTGAAPAAVSPAAPASTTSLPAPVTVAEAPADQTAATATLAGLSTGHRAPAASAGPDLTSRDLPATWLPAGALLALVALGALQVARRTNLGVSAPR